MLMPVRDGEPRHLSRALKSTLRSRDVDFGVVVVDHGSVVPVEVSDVRVRVVRVDRALPFAEALELGRAACSAPFIARMDSDDVMHPLRLAEQVASLSSDPSLAAVASRAKIIPKATTLMRGYVGWQNGILDDSQHSKEAWIEQPIVNPATTYRASMLDEIGGWRARDWPEDYDLFLRMIVAGRRVIKRPEIRHAWRQHFGQLTRMVKATQTRDALAACKAHHLAPHFQLRERKVVIVGAGKEGRRISRALRAEGVVVSSFVDVDPKKIGRRVHDVEVCASIEGARSPSGGPSGTFVVGAVGTSGARGAVRAFVEAAGFVEGVDFVIVT